MTGKVISTNAVPLSHSVRHTMAPGWLRPSGILFFVLAVSSFVHAQPPPSPAEATAVPGTELHDNVAYIKPGYKFVKRGDAVDVLPEGGEVQNRHLHLSV